MTRTNRMDRRAAGAATLALLSLFFIVFSLHFGTFARAQSPAATDAPPVAGEQAGSPAKTGLPTVLSATDTALDSDDHPPLYDNDLNKLIRRLAINLFFTSMVVFVAHRLGRSQSDFIFTFLLMNIMIFFICFALKKLELELGMALGLFAIFGIIRYRTDAINVRDMTYLFVVIGLAVINALSNKKTSYAELFFANGFIVASTVMLERLIPYEPTIAELKAKRQTQQFVCDDLELLKPENREKLMERIHDQLGIRAERLVIKKIDTVTGHGNVTVHYDPTKQDI